MSSSIGNKVISVFKHPRWQVNPTAVSSACKILGLRYTATITLKRDAESFWWGTYDVFPLHAISLNPTIPKSKVSLTIWHELAHAMQCERDFNCDGEAFLEQVDADYAKVMEADGRPTFDLDHEDYKEWYDRFYATIPMEGEAESIARCHAKRYPLIT